jgi:hypothetical protein
MYPDPGSFNDRRAMKKMIDRATVANAEEILFLQKLGYKIFKTVKANDRLNRVYLEKLRNL